MKFTFKFKREKIDETHWTLRPKVPTTLSYGGLNKDFIAVLDTGSDVVYIPQDIAEYFGLELSKKVDVCQGAETEFRFKTAKIYIEIRKGHSQFKELFDVIVPVENPLHKDIILGTPFLSNFVVTFDYARNKIILKSALPRFDIKKLRYKRR